MNQKEKLSVTPVTKPVFLQVTKNNMTIDELFNIIEDRKRNMPKNSYVASLFKAGQDRIIQKVGEEVTEVVITAKNKNKKRIVYEVADLLFHILILLAFFNIKLSDIRKELESRRK